MAEHKSRVVWSPEALDDIDRLWDYYAQAAGRATANKLLREVARIVAILDDFPFTGRSREELRAGLRSLVAGTHTVFCRLQADRPEIVRVIDGRQDIEDIFS